jgi:hypothetical protein
LDIRYVLPDLLTLKSSGEITDDGYDYAGNVPYLLLFLRTEDVKRGVLLLLETLENERLFGNDLVEAVVIAVERDGKTAVEYPKDFKRTFPE